MVMDCGVVGLRVYGIGFNVSVLVLFMPMISTTRNNRIGIENVKIQKVTLMHKLGQFKQILPNHMLFN